MRPPLAPLGPAPSSDPDREAGLATVEFALIAVLLFMLLFGIVMYGMILAVKGTVSQAAAEAARAAVPGATFADASSSATVQAGRSAGWLGGTCNSGQLTCIVTPPYQCDPAVPGVFCIKVTVKYDWSAHALFPQLPFLPEPTASSPIQSESVVRINATS